MTISEIRLANVEKIIEKYFDNNKSKFAKAIGKFPTYVSKWWAENNQRNIGASSARLIENAVNLEKGWLDTIHNQLGEEAATYDLSAGKKIQRIPINGTAQLGDDGFWEFIDENGADGFISIPSDDEDAYSLCLKGDSMRPAIKSGWYAVCEPKHEPVLGEYVHVTTKDGRSMVKELLIYNANQIVLDSVNEDHKRITFDPSEIETIHYAFIVPPSKHSL